MCIRRAAVRIFTGFLLTTSVLAGNTPSTRATEEKTQAPMPPIINLSGGLRSMAWGGSVEAFFLNGKASGILGAGGIPPPSELYSGWSKPAYTFALRVYFGELDSRPFIDLSFSAVATSNVAGPDYGPGLQIGYCFLAESGPTLSLGAGVGYATRNQMFGPTLVLEAGFTFR